MKPIRIAKTLVSCLACCSAALILAGCASSKHKTGYAPCSDNVKAHIPFITCQPLDAEVKANAGNSATFSIEAEGQKLTYQWYGKKAADKDFLAINGGSAKNLTIASVTAADYGLYYCVVGSEDSNGDLAMVQSRMASLGGALNGAAGPFTPVQNPVTAGTVTKICNNPVSGHWDRFPGTDTPGTGVTGVKCKIINVSNASVVPNDSYYLQWWVTAANTDCMSISPDDGGTTWVTCNVTPNLVYRFIAHFKSGQAPPDGTVLQLVGTWLP
jgi:hypothetical protein